MENGSDGRYIVCDSENKVWGVGGSIRDACINVMNPACNQNARDKEIASVLEFFEDDFEVWCLLPAHKSLYKSFIETTKINEKNQQEVTKECEFDAFVSALDDFLICKTICLEVNGIVVLKEHKVK